MSTVDVSKRFSQTFKKTMNAYTHDGSSASNGLHQEGAFAVRCAMLDTTAISYNVVGARSVCARTVVVTAPDDGLDSEVPRENRDLRRIGFAV